MIKLSNAIAPAGLFVICILGWFLFYQEREAHLKTKEWLNPKLSYYFPAGKYDVSSLDSVFREHKAVILKHERIKHFTVHADSSGKIISVALTR